MGEIPRSQMRKHAILMMATLPRVIYRVKAIPSKIPHALFAKLMEIDPQNPRETQGTQNSQNNLGKTKVGESYFLISKLTTKLQQSILCGNGRGIQIDEQN